MNKRASRVIACFISVAALSAPLIFSSRAQAQNLPGENGIRFSPTVNAATDVNWDQKLDNQVAPETTFRDENNKAVPLGTYFGDKPIVVVMPFYKCPGMCTAELQGMVDTFRDAKTKFKVGRDFQVVTVSINPKETSDLALAKKKEYLDVLEQPGAENGWHFLTGDEKSIRKLADDIGFRYKYLQNDQYAHPSGIVILTPKGKVSRYAFGVQYSPAQFRLSITDAGQGRVGTPIDKFILACYHYDPQTGKYGLAVFRIIQFFCFATVLTLGSFMFVMFRKDIKDSQAAKTGLKMSKDEGQS